MSADHEIIHMDPWGKEGAPALGTILRRSQLCELPPIRELVQGVMSEPAAVLLVGPPGAGKSALCLGLANCIGTGHTWLGRPVSRRRSLFVIGEGASGLDVRSKAWEIAWQEGKPVPDDDVTFIVKPDTLRNRNTWQQLGEYANAGGYRFIVLDTFSSLAPDVDEIKDAPLIMRHLSDLAAAIDGTCVLVHHPGWGDATRARGGSQLEANADEVLILTGTADSPLISLTRKKVKDGESGSTLWLNRKPIGGSIIIETARPADIEAPLRTRIVNILTAMAEQGITGPQLMDECGVDPKKRRSAFYEALKKLRNAGDVKCKGSGRAATYFLTDHAPEVAE